MLTYLGVKLLLTFKMIEKNEENLEAAFPNSRVSFSCGEDAASVEDSLGCLVVLTAACVEKKPP